MTRKILFCSTSTRLSTGYAKIGFEILNFIHTNRPEWNIFHLAFQHSNLDKIEDRDIPGITVIPDDLFGYDKILDHVREIEPDVVVLYNDTIVSSNFCDKFKNLSKRNFKFFIYLDLTYEHQKFLKNICDNSDKIIAFHSGWKNHLIRDVKLPPEKIIHIDHPIVEHPIPTEFSNFGTDPNDFIVLNLNRNSYRKMLDITIDGFIKFFKRNNCKENLKLFLGCKFTFEGSYNIVELVDTMANINNLNSEQKNILMNKCILRFPHDSVSDETIHKLYNRCDVGVNTGGGEGWGLCNLEHQMFKKPQIITRTQNFENFFKKDFVHFLEPVSRIYISNEQDVVGGILEIPSPNDFANALQHLYENPDIRSEWGEKGYQHLKNMKNNFSSWLSILSN